MPYPTSGETNLDPASITPPFPAVYHVTARSHGGQEVPLMVRYQGLINGQHLWAPVVETSAGSTPGNAGTEVVPLRACLNGVEIPGFAYMDDMSGSPTIIGETWRDPATGVWGALPAGAVIGACAVSTTGTPAIGSAYANDVSTLPTATSISIQKPCGSVVMVTTSAGSFLINSASTGYSVGDFKSPITVQSVTVISGSAALTDIIVTAQRDA